MLQFSVPPGFVIKNKEGLLIRISEILIYVMKLSYSFIGKGYSIQDAGSVTCALFYFIGLQCCTELQK